MCSSDCVSKTDMEVLKNFTLMKDICVRPHIYSLMSSTSSSNKFLLVYVENVNDIDYEKIMIINAIGLRRILLMKI
jgi:hypothetical protein